LPFFLFFLVSSSSCCSFLFSVPPDGTDLKPCGPPIFINSSFCGPCLLFYGLCSSSILGIERERERGRARVEKEACGPRRASFSSFPRPLSIYLSLFFSKKDKKGKKRSFAFPLVESKGGHGRAKSETRTGGEGMESALSFFGVSLFPPRHSHFYFLPFQKKKKRQPSSSASAATSPPSSATPREPPSSTSSTLAPRSATGTQ
jgi:hypothetical protein